MFRRSVLTENGYMKSNNIYYLIFLVLHGPFCPRRNLGAVAVLVCHLIIGKISIPGVGASIELWTRMIYNGTPKPQAGESRGSRVMYKL